MNTNLRDGILAVFDFAEKIEGGLFRAMLALTPYRYNTHYIDIQKGISEYEKDLKKDSILELNSITKERVRVFRFKEFNDPTRILEAMHALGYRPGTLLEFLYVGTEIDNNYSYRRIYVVGNGERYYVRIESVLDRTIQARGGLPYEAKHEIFAIKT